MAAAWDRSRVPTAPTAPAYSPCGGGTLPVIVGRYSEGEKFTVTVLREPSAVHRTVPAFKKNNSLVLLSLTLKRAHFLLVNFIYIQVVIPLWGVHVCLKF